LPSIKCLWEALFAPYVDPVGGLKTTFPLAGVDKSQHFPVIHSSRMLEVLWVDGGAEHQPQVDVYFELCLKDIQSV
jgi:hypothetical protein